MGQRGSMLANINVLISIALLASALCWPYIQKGVNWWWEQEVEEFVTAIEESEKKYKDYNNKFFSFTLNGEHLPKGANKNHTQLQTVKKKLKEAKYYDYSVVVKDSNTYEIIANLKRNVLMEWWFVINKNFKSELTFARTWR